MNFIFFMQLLLFGNKTLQLIIKIIFVCGTIFKYSYQLYHLQTVLLMGILFKLPIPVSIHYVLVLARVSTKQGLLVISCLNTAKAYDVSNLYMIFWK